MLNKYVLGIDQSTQGSKVLLFDVSGKLVERCDLVHKQHVSEQGWVSHDGEEIYNNIIRLVPMLVEKAGIRKEEIICIGISNQRETSIAWDESGTPAAKAIVWQCARASSITDNLEQLGFNDEIKNRTGIPLSPYFPAAKIAWLLKNEPGVKELLNKGELHIGTMDSYILYRLTNGTSYKTEYSNASRTQLFNISELQWDSKVCDMFGIPQEILPTVCDSNAKFGETDFEGYLDVKIPILAMLGDSHGALYGHGCFQKGMVKATYGTGSSVMMNIGKEPIISKHGLITSLAYGINGEVDYVLEGNLNYTGAIIPWLIDGLGLIQYASETEQLIKEANPLDTTYLVPAFSGLGAPYWNDDAKAVMNGMSRLTRKAEIVKAAVESIAYQVTDIIFAMKEDANLEIPILRTDGGVTKNEYLMKFQSDLLHIPVYVPFVEEFSGLGVAYLAGITYGIYHKEQLFDQIQVKEYTFSMDEDVVKIKYEGWKKAVYSAIS